MIALIIGVGVIILTAVVNQIARESLLLLSRYLGLRIIRRAAKALPEKRRMIREPEWLAEFQGQLDKGLCSSSLTFAFGCMISAHRIRREAPAAAQSPDGERSASPAARSRYLRRLARGLLGPEVRWRDIVQDASDGGLAVIGAAWFLALITLPAGAWLVSRHGDMRLAGMVVLGGCACYTLMGVGVLARRLQLRLAKHRPGRRSTG